MSVHELKIWPEHFHDVCIGRKLNEIRFNDRDYKELDLLVLNEFDPTKCEYTGRKVRVLVKHISDFKQQPGYVVLSIELRSLAIYPCVWKEARDYDGDTYWQTGCGEAYMLFDGLSPTENGHKYCHHCGGSLITVGLPIHHDEEEER